MARKGKPKQLSLRHYDMCLSLFIILKEHIWPVLFQDLTGNLHQFILFVDQSKRVYLYFLVF